MGFCCTCIVRYASKYFFFAFTIYSLSKGPTGSVFSVYKLVPLVARFINASRVNRTRNSTWPDLGLSMYTYIMLDFRKHLCYNRLLPSSSFFRLNISKLDNKKTKSITFSLFLLAPSIFPPFPSALWFLDLLLSLLSFKWVQFSVGTYSKIQLLISYWMGLSMNWRTEPFSLSQWYESRIR